MRLTAELILGATDAINPVRERELDLRGILGINIYLLNN